MKHETEKTYSTVEQDDVKHWVLFSGGHDSLVTTHYLMENGYCEAVLHLDTQTGIPETQEFVIETCEQYGWPLRIEASAVTLKQWCLELGGDDVPYGFPRPQFHSFIYRWLKELQLAQVARETDGKPHYWTGVRRDESDRRMRTVAEPIKEVDRWYWHSPLRNWTDDRLEAYIEDHDLPRNPVVKAMHKSGECFCGAYDDRDTTLIDLQANYPDHYEWLMELEQEVIEEIGEDEEKSYWAHNSLSESDLYHLQSLRDPETDMVLCRDCRAANLNEADDVDW